jgi:hypothetical protein
MKLKNEDESRSLHCAVGMTGLHLRALEKK